MLRIGHFARITCVGVKTLRYYDQIGLLTPAHIDKFTGYRYYALAQWQRLNRILALKDLGLSLDQIAQILSDDLSDEALRGMLRLVSVELKEQIHGMQSKLERVEKRLNKLELEDVMPALDIVVKEVAALRIVGQHQTCNENFQQVFDGVFDNMIDFAQTQGIKYAAPLMAVFYEDPVDAGGEADFEVAVPTNDEFAVPERMRVHTLPAVEQMATAIVVGALTPDEWDVAYEDLLEWIEVHGYVVDGPYRDIYHQVDKENNDAGSVTEIQFPIRKKS